MGAGIRGSIVGIATIEWGGAIQEALGIILSCHMADKILDILPRYPVNMYQFFCMEVYGIFWIKRKVTMP